MVYQYKSNARIPVPAQVAGEECARLEGEGRLTPHDLVEESRPEDAPLHRAFEWDDSIAAERYREVQAGHIIRCVVSVPEGSRSSEPVRAFVSIASEDGPRYRRIDAVLRRADTREQMLAQAVSELGAFRRKYAALRELALVFDAIDGVVGGREALVA